MKTTFIIWKSQDDHNVDDVNDVVGLFEGTYLEADELIDRLNKADRSVKEGPFGRVWFGYWRSEPNFINANDKAEDIIL